MRAGPHAMLPAGDRQDLGAAGVDRRLVARVWQFARPYRHFLAAYLGVLVAGALLNLAPPLIYREVIDRAIPTLDRGLVTTLALLAVGVAVLNLGADLVERWLSARIGEGLIFDLRRALFDHVQRMPLSFFTRTQTGAVVSRLNNDVIGAQRALTGTLGQVVFNVFTLVTTVTAMLLLEWRLTVLALVLLPCFIVPAKRVGRRLQELTREAMALNAAMNATMTERFNVAGALLVKLFGRHDDEEAAFAERAGRVRAIGVRSALYGRAFFASLTLVGAIGVAAVYWAGAQLVISGVVTLGTLVALAAYVTRIYQPLTSLTNARVDVLTALVSFERVFEVLDTPHAIDDAPGAVELVDPVGRVELDDVWFRYPAAGDVSIPSLEAEGSDGTGAPAPRADGPGEGGWVLRGVTATIEPGRMVALVGPSGAGKTTLASLVPRLYEATAGAVRVDGHGVRLLTQRSLRRAVGVVSQDPHLFHDTVASNLRYARPDASDADLVEACRAAQVLDVITALPQGFDTIVGERGYRLSGGEKQRLAIARVLLKDPAVVILDEATSHLDAGSEAAVQAALATVLAGRTSIVIAHRLSTVQAADEILVLDRGVIVERGVHDELVALDGLYARLYRTLVRSGGPVPDEPVAP